MPTPGTQKYQKETRLHESSSMACRSGTVKVIGGDYQQSCTCTLAFTVLHSVLVICHGCKEDVTNRQSSDNAEDDVEIGEHEKKTVVDSDDEGDNELPTGAAVVADESAVPPRNFQEKKKKSEEEVRQGPIARPVSDDFRRFFTQIATEYGGDPIPTVADYS